MGLIQRPNGNGPDQDQNQPNSAGVSLDYVDDLIGADD
jgi:hypothetical protein